MATSGQLIEKVSQVCGLPAVTVGTYYKALREAGLTSKSGRGPSAAQMTVGDVANLLIALTSGVQAKDVANEVRRIRAFKRRPAAATVRVDALDGRIDGDNFGEFFENLLRLHQEGRLQDVLAAIPADLFPKFPALAKWSRSQGKRISRKSEDEAALETIFHIDFTIDDDTIEVPIQRDYAGRENAVDGAFFMPDEIVTGRTPGIVTSKQLLHWAVWYIVDLLNDEGADN